MPDVSFGLYHDLMFAFQCAQSRRVHHFDGCGFACPEMELLCGLRDEHREAADGVAGGVACFLDEACFEGIVDEIVDEMCAAKLMGAGGCVVLMMPVCAEGGGVDDDVEAVEGGGVELLEGGV